MSLATLYSRAQCGIEAPLVTVEVYLANGLPSFSIVGLPETTVKESKDRVRGAILNSQFEFPARRITVNLAPADLPKDGGRYDLAIALGILAASGQLPQQKLTAYEFAGELALSGELRPIHGALPIAIQAAAAGRPLMIPHGNVREAGLVSQAAILAAGHLLDVCAHLCERKLIAPAPATAAATPTPEAGIDLADIRGQHHAKRALQIAAAGGHSLLLIGPPGSGKTMLATRLAAILPYMTEQEALASACIASISQQGFDHRRWRQRPFRSPHHTASAVALVGGGSQPKPGEISLAHNGVMFLDELPEYDRRVLEVLREPLESGCIHISRATQQAIFPARFQLIAAMNPCPCGYLGDRHHPCRCTEEQVQRYRSRISGPLLDRIDMHIEVPRISRQHLHTRSEQDITSRQARELVSAARQRQLERCDTANHLLSVAQIERHCRLQQQDYALLEQACERLGLSARAYHRILKVARTIADLDGAEQIQRQHVSEAISYRRLDRAATSPHSLSPATP